MRATATISVAQDNVTLDRADLNTDLQKERERSVLQYVALGAPNND